MRDEVHEKLHQRNFPFRKIKFYERENDLINQDAESYVSIPLNAFALIKRFINDSSLIKDRISSCSDKFTQKVENLSSASFHDLQGAVEGFERLQDVYKFKTEEFVNGIINGDDYNTTLSTHDLFIVGTEFMKLSKFPEAIEYLDECLKKSKVPSEFTEVNQAQIMSVLVEAHEGNSNFAKAQEFLDEIAKIGFENQEEIEKKRSLLQMKQQEENVLKAPLRQPIEINLTKKLCNDEIRLSEAVTSKLRCRYVSNSLFSKIAPYKLEEAHLDPLIVLYHDVIFDSEIDFLKKLAEPKLGHSMIFGSGGNQSVSAGTRISKVAWFGDSINPIIAKLSKRAQDMTGLTTATAEPLQLQRYGLAGFYKSHYDFVGEKSNFTNGDRIGTVLFYVKQLLSIFIEVSKFYQTFRR